MTLNAKVNAPGGWSQKKLDSTVEATILSEGLRVEMQEMMSEIDGLQEASSGEMAFEQIEAERSELADSSTSSPPSSDSPTKSPNTQSTSLRGSDAKNVADEHGEVTSSATACSFLPSLVIMLIIQVLDDDAFKR